MMKVFAIYDVKAAAYGMPLFFATRGLALRGLADACSSGKSQLSEHPGDYSLHELAEYDSSSGKFTSYPNPEFVVSVAALVDQIIAARRAPGAAVAAAVEAGKNEIGQQETLISH